MSLGWLTESSLIPKEPKSISGVGAASLLNLQAVVYERERRGNVPSAKRQRIIAEAKAKNDGVAWLQARRLQEDRSQAEIVKVKDKESTHFIVRNELREQMAKRQRIIAPTSDLPERPALVRARLEEKAKKYEAMAAGGYASSSQDAPLVDFHRKRSEAEVLGIAPVPVTGEDAAAFVPPPEEPMNPAAAFASAAPSNKDKPYVPLAKQNSGPLWAPPKVPTQLQTEFRTHYGHFREGPKRFITQMDYHLLIQL
ncbi:hypothetical protein AK812_SmicGene3766 [Symbiodinium microadriaticum]|uniref:Uncharacterized protein n=1 Tax=Symbiodinium microadriaticum TaxID=2951 RepID=A0A1Q9EY75_SYMMI|nr:hypothetical protein AK812_SmicGene3766 [Symbiodinium microadriaticum]